MSRARCRVVVVSFAAGLSVLDADAQAPLAGVCGPSPGAAGHPVQAAEGPKPVASRSTALITTSRGEIRVELLVDEAPLAVASFVMLAQRGFYDGLSFDRVLARMAVEGGCPYAKGLGWPGYTFEDEFRTSLRHDRPGRVSLLNAGPNTNGSRFTITLRAAPAMDDRNTIFARVITGMEALARIEAGDCIQSVRIEEAPVTPSALVERVESWKRRVEARFPTGPPGTCDSRSGKAPSAPAGAATPAASPDASKAEGGRTVHDPPAESASSPPGPR